MAACFAMAKLSYFRAHRLRVHRHALLGTAAQTASTETIRAAAWDPLSVLTDALHVRRLLTTNYDTEIERHLKGRGFQLEGFSPRYLKVGGRWRDHNRWALLVEDWKARRRQRRR